MPEITARTGRTPRYAPITFTLLLLLASLAISALPATSWQWETAIFVFPNNSSWAFTNEVIWTLQTEFWSTEIESEFESNGWKHFGVSIELSFGDMQLESEVRFQPDKDRFRDWITDLEWDWDCLTLTLTTKLTYSTDWLILEADYQTNLIGIDTSFRLRAPSGACELEFYDAGLEVSFEWYGIKTEVDLDMDADDFDELTLTLADVEVPAISWATFDTELTYELNEKSLSFESTVYLEPADCLELELEVEASHPRSIYPLHITEALLECGIGTWDIEATVILDESEWIEDLYWLDVESSAEFEAVFCGHIALEFQLLWTQEALGSIVSAFWYEPSDKLRIGFESCLKPADGVLESVSLSIETTW